MCILVFVLFCLFFVFVCLLWHLLLLLIKAGSVRLELMEGSVFIVSRFSSFRVDGRQFIYRKPVLFVQLMECSVFTVSRFSSFRVDGRQCIYRKPVQFVQS